jgi:hypothetical protein
VLMTEDARRSRWPIVALLAGIAAVVLIALVAVLARGPAQYDPGTPEGVVQRYSQAVIDGDHATALTYLVPEVAESCEKLPSGSGDHRMTLLGTTERDDTARVEVLIATIYDSGLLGPGEFESEEAFDLVKDGDSWLIETAPFQLSICRERF